MKKLIISCAALLCLAGRPAAQSPVLSNTILWKISGNGLTKDSYILLTGNSCNEKINLPEKVTNAIKSVGAIAVERNLYDKDAQKLQANTLAKADSQRIKNNLTPTEYQSFVAMLKNAGAPDPVISSFGSLKIGMVYYALLMTQNPCGMQSSPPLYEVMFKNYAAKNGLSYTVLQNVDDYLAEYNSYTNDYWRSNIQNVLKNAGETKEALKSEIDFYNSENLKSLQSLYNGNLFFRLQYPGAYQKAHVQYLADKIESYIRLTPLLAAVNISNIVVKDASLFSLLQKKGYSITPVN